MASIGFNTGTVDPQAPLEVLPTGWYQMQITAAELAMAQSTDAGEMVVLEFTVDPNVHPDLNNRKVRSWFCKDHKKQQTRDIARRQLSAIAHAIENPEIDDTNDFLGGELMVRLKPSSRDGYNDCSGFAAVGEQAPLGAGPQKKAARPAPAAADDEDEDEDEAEQEPAPRKRNGKPSWK
jgi:hypothetical protein